MASLDGQVLEEFSQVEYLNPWFLYEERKAQLTSRPMDPREYEAVIEQILDELGI